MAWTKEDVARGEGGAGAEGPGQRAEIRLNTFAGPSSIKCVRVSNWYGPQLASARATTRSLYQRT
jgi:hypothetical protein